ncbi:MAG: hypothetical protein JF591_05085, partial [Lysobacter sp.]|nr:hypothetical protein [Lysobacter sp.]
GGVLSMRLGTTGPDAAGIVVPAGGATLGVAAARAIAAAGDSRSCGGGGLSGSLGGELTGGATGGAGAGRSGTAVAVAGNADAAGATGAGRGSLARAGVAGGACCAPLDPAASNSPPTTLAAPMARIQPLDFMVPPDLAPRAARERIQDAAAGDADRASARRV